MQRSSRDGAGLEAEALGPDKAKVDGRAPTSPGAAGAKSPLVETYLMKRQNLVRYLAARCGSHSQAEDLAQDLFVKIAALDPSLRVESPSALLYRMAANLATDQLRSRRRAMARDHAWADLGSSLDGPAVDHATGEQTLASRQDLAALLAAIENLPPRRREAFRLHKVEGLTCAETARILGVSVKAVERQITAALKALAWRRDQ